MPAQNTYTTTTPADGDYVTGVDISDTTQNASGSTRSFLMSAIATYVKGAINTLQNIFISPADATVPLAAQRHSSGQTANLFEVRDESGTALGSFNKYGDIYPARIGVGADGLARGSNWDSLIDVEHYSLTPTTVNNTIYGQYIGLSLANAIRVSNLYGLVYFVTSGAQANNLDQVSGVTGNAYHGSGSSATVTLVLGGDFWAGVAGSSGTVTTLIGSRTRLDNSGSKTVTTAYGQKIEIGGSPSIGTLYGLYLDSVSGKGASTAYAIYSAGGLSHLDSLELATDLAITEGGTGASTAAGARTNLDVPSNDDAIAYAMIFG